jgi:hypothetical protein
MAVEDTKKTESTTAPVSDIAIGIVDSIDGKLSDLDETIADRVFEAQAALVNRAVQQIGMGRYQWGLFFVAGYGWLCDQVSTITSHRFTTFLLYSL